jgi:hypothetical protein
VIVYGADTSGFNVCTLADGAPIAANDEQRSESDTDPKMHLDLAARTIVVEDGPLGAEWRIALSLAEPMGCGLDGTFTGVAINPAGETSEVALSLGKSAELSWRGGEPGAAALEPAACADGLIALHGGGMELSIQAGPGWGSFGGRVSGALSGPIAALKTR